MGINRDKEHKRRATGGKRISIMKKRKYNLGRQAAMTKLGHKRVHQVRCMGGNLKFRAMRLDTGNFSWGSEAFTHKSRVMDVVYNSSNNELVRTKTLVKNTIILIDAAPFKTWYQNHYGVEIGKKKSKQGKSAAEEKTEVTTPRIPARVSCATVLLPVLVPHLAPCLTLHQEKKSFNVEKKLKARQATRVLASAVDDQIANGRLLACISSRPGQTGRVEGYILEGKELEFYQRQLNKKKSKK